jgi:hypothetical protein
MTDDKEMDRKAKQKQMASTNNGIKNEAAATDVSSFFVCLMT